MKAPQTETNRDYQLVPQGTFLANLYRIVYIGTVPVEWQGKVKDLYKVRLFWELPDEKKVWKDSEGNEQEGVFSISREFTLSMGEKSNLRPIVEGMIGTSLTDEEAYAFDIDDLLGKPCLITIAHEKSADKTKTFALVKSTANLMKGQKPLTLVNEKSVFNVNTATERQVEDLPQYLRDKVRTSKEYKGNKKIEEVADELVADDKAVEYPDDEINPEDIPF